jgi:hypothetical protein
LNVGPIWIEDATLADLHTAGLAYDFEVPGRTPPERITTELG